ncbi:phospholipase D family protein [Ferrimonas lipolytica]|uniref:Phospholipase D family protein n=1 Tax=Ferrimonas lipolytica TaxID=2724191 RepID=A0A6H1UH43_9GAMM|nr:phospholipase D family protein [Ferrimonas lipolytica]QIZ77949.1 phospholipase D family protein [Ferrimonas lipolytica]
MKRILNVLMLLSGVLLTVGCSSIPIEQHAQPSFARNQHQPSHLKDVLAASLQQHSGQSGFAIISEAQQALQSRLAMANVAEHSLDMQYYIWHDDLSGVALLSAIYRAAERGVRVRTLLDDYTVLTADADLARIANHPNIEIKLYNPYGKRRSGSFARTLAFFGEFGRLNHRMHNKLMVADNQLAITGGRNIGDEYFGLSDRKNFVDIDMFAVGPVVHDLSNSFDRYWNSDWAVSIDSIRSFDPFSGELEILSAAEIEQVLQQRMQGYPTAPYTIEMDRQQLLAQVETIPSLLRWSHATVTADPPRKDLEQQLEPLAVIELLTQLGANAEHEILISSPYFIPGTIMVDGLSQLNQRGVEVKVLTNSLRTNDVAAAHYGYANIREQVLATGTKVYELRTDSAPGSLTQPQSKRGVELGLHAKVAVYDRRWVYIGTANLDPRSQLLNTEMGVVVDDPILAQQLAKQLLGLMTQKSAYRLHHQQAATCWFWIDNNNFEQQCSEPNVGWGDALMMKLVELLPIEEQL